MAVETLKPKSVKAPLPRLLCMVSIDEPLRGESVHLNRTIK